MSFYGLYLSLVLAAAPAGKAEVAKELLPPVPIQAEGQAIDVQRVGHSAPFLGDFDGDGIFDLLVGQFHEGRLRIYRNTGSNARPKFQGFTWFQAGGQIASVPVG